MSVEVMINNKTLKILLSEISEYVLGNTKILQEADQFQLKDANDDCVSEQYLFDHCLNNDYKTINFAEYQNALNLGTMKDPSLDKMVSKLKHYLGVSELGIFAFYPKNSKLSWHHNGNSAGNTILFSYSIDGKGFFRYYDYDTKSIVDMHDKVGWFAKWNTFKDPAITDKVFWHCAQTENYRISIGFGVPSRYKQRVLELISLDE